jgi:hypothetical protein
MKLKQAMILIWDKLECPVSTLFIFPLALGLVLAIMVAGLTIVIFIYVMIGKFAYWIWNLL